MTVLLTDNLPLLAGAPNGIKKLRELILELAVRGKLVPQDPSDEPASELLKNIAKEKALLIENKTIRKGKPLPGIEQDEMQFRLPIGWEWIRLGQIGDWGAGATPTRGNSSYYGGEMPWFKSGELIADFISASEESVTELALKECSLRRNKPGDVLIAMYGATIGKTAILSVEGTTNQAVCACTPFNGVFNRYLLLTLKALKSNFIGQGAGGAQPNISREKIVATVTGLPPLAEQHRIVAKVDELMALCDRLEAQQADAESAHAQLVQALLDSLTRSSDATAMDGGNAENAGAIFGQDFATSWQRLAEHFHTLFTTEPSIDALKQTLLQLAVMGKLVPQDPRDEPASELLKRIAEEKARLISEEGLRTTAREDVPETEHYFTLHAGWASCRLGNLARFIDYRGRTPTKTSSGVALITAKNVRPGFISREPQEFIADTDYLSWMIRGVPRVGDMLFTTEAPMGNVAIIDIAERFALAQRVICFQLHELGTGLFLKLAMMSSGFQAQLSDAATGMTATGIKSSRLKEIPVPIPPLPEQHRIVAKVDQLMALCDQLKTRLTQARKLNEQLASTLIERALVDNGQQAPVATDQKVARTLLAAEITHQLHGQRTFGQRKLQKVIYLAEHAARLAAVQGSYLRDAAGPHDRQLMNQVENELCNRQWYECIDRETFGHAYRPLSQAGQHRQAYNSAWSTAERATIERVIYLMRDWDTDRCEMTVTLYAAWNDFILEGRQVTDEAIVDEVMHSWNDAKLRFGKDEWLAVLTDMKKHELLIPTGFGQRTIGGMLTLPGVE